MKLATEDSVEDKGRWKIVRLDNCTDVEGDIVSADDATGECSILVAGEIKPLSFPGGIKIVGRRR